MCMKMSEQMRIDILFINTNIKTLQQNNGFSLEFRLFSDLVRKTNR